MLECIVGAQSAAATQPQRSRAKEWLRRYLPAEIMSLIVTLSCSWIALTLTNDFVIVAFVGTWAENLAYYGTIVGRDLRAQEQPTLRGILHTLRNILLEFGPAELLDSIIIRPTALYAGLALAPVPAIGIIAGKLVADFIFYLPTIISYEWLRGRHNGGTHQ